MHRRTLHTGRQSRQKTKCNPNNKIDKIWCGNLSRCLFIFHNCGPLCNYKFGNIYVWLQCFVCELTRHGQLGLAMEHRVSVCAKAIGTVHEICINVQHWTWRTGTTHTCIHTASVIPNNQCMNVVKKSVFVKSLLVLFCMSFWGMLFQEIWKKEKKNNNNHNNRSQLPRQYCWIPAGPWPWGYNCNPQTLVCEPNAGNIKMLNECLNSKFDLANYQTPF